VFALRRLCLDHRYAAAIICIAALALRMLVPAGYMISSEAGGIGVTICSTMPARPYPEAMATMHHGMADHGLSGDHGQSLEHGSSRDHGPSRDHGKAEMPCAFSSLSSQALGGVDPILVVAAIAFFMAAGLQPERRLAVPLRLNLWPPMRGPPARP
jgi:hypothetical protein